MFPGLRYQTGNQTREYIPLFTMQRFLSGRSSQDINSRFKYYKASFTRYLRSASAAPILTQPMGQLWVPVYRKGNKPPKGESSPELEISGAKTQDHLTIVPSGLNH